MRVKSLHTINFGNNIEDDPLFLLKGGFCYEHKKKSKSNEVNPKVFCANFGVHFSKVLGSIYIITKREFSVFYSWKQQFRYAIYLLSPPCCGISILKLGDSLTYLHGRISKPAMIACLSLSAFQLLFEVIRS